MANVGCTGSNDVEVDHASDVEIGRAPAEQVSWQVVDRTLVGISRRRAALDAAEAKWLRAAVRVKIWRQLGCVSLLDYLERRLGYAPRTAYERIRVAEALAELPQLEAALGNGMPFSAVRELTRVATPETEGVWIEACRDRSVHEIEQRVSGRAKGSLPTDPASPDLALRDVTLRELRPTTRALLRQARAKAQHERGASLSDDELVAHVFGAFLDGHATEPAVARHQIAVVVCERCGQGWQEGAGRKHAMDRAEVETACCDAQHIGSIHDDPARATQDVPPRVRRHVYRRDGGHCRAPGCRSAANLDLHHIKPRALGGDHDPSNLVMLCGGCHTAHHRGLIAITGTADNLAVVRVGLAGPSAPLKPGDPQPSVAGAAASEAAHVDTGQGGAADFSADVDLPTAEPDAAITAASARVGTTPRSRFALEALRSDARLALTTLGFKRHEVATPVDEALSALGTTATLEGLIRAALSQLARSRA